MQLDQIPTFDKDGAIYVVVESPRGSSVKLKYHRQLGALTLSRPLPAGLTYPHDWGFVPGTLASDGDPVDALVLSDVGTAPGVVIACRPIGVLEIEQNRRTVTDVSATTGSSPSRGAPIDSTHWRTSSRCPSGRGTRSPPSSSRRPRSNVKT